MNEQVRRFIHRGTTFGQQSAHRWEWTVLNGGPGMRCANDDCRSLWMPDQVQPLTSCPQRQRQR